MPITTIFFSPNFENLNDPSVFIVLLFEVHEYVITYLPLVMHLLSIHSDSDSAYLGKSIKDQ